MVTMLAVYVVIGLAVFFIEFRFGGWMYSCMKSSFPIFIYFAFVIVFGWPAVLKDTVIFEKY